MTIVLLACAAIGTTGARADLPQPVTTTAPVRANEPVVLTGSLFPDWSAGPELTFRASQVPVDYGVADSQGLQPAYLRSDCYVANPPPDVNGYVDTNHDDHNCYQSNQLPFRTAPGRTGVDPNALLGYRWDGKRNRFVQIPFQVDTKWIHYISNNASGFAFYSGVDQELTYTFDREGFRFTTNAPFNPSNPAVVCQSAPVGGIAAAPDPNPWLIDTDEMAFMARDAGAQAPPGATLPRGIADAREVVITDPLQLPLRRALGHGLDHGLAGRQGPEHRRLRAEHRRPLEGSRVSADARRQRALLRLRGRGDELGRIIATDGREVRAGAHDPRHVGRRFFDQQHQDRDLLLGRGALSGSPSRARDPASRRHLRAA